MHDTLEIGILAYTYCSTIKDAIQLSLQMTYLQTFKNKKALVTGHTGFKGSWLSAWLHLLEVDVYGISLEYSPSCPSHFDVTELSEIVEDQRVDIRNSNELTECVNDIKPDFVFI